MKFIVTIIVLLFSLNSYSASKDLQNKQNLPENFPSILRAEEVKTLNFLKNLSVRWGLTSEALLDKHSLKQLKKTMRQIVNLMDGQHEFNRTYLHNYLLYSTEKAWQGLHHNIKVAELLADNPGLFEQLLDDLTLLRALSINYEYYGEDYPKKTCKRTLAKTIFLAKKRYVTN